MRHHFLVFLPPLFRFPSGRIPWLSVGKPERNATVVNVHSQHERGVFLQNNYSRSSSPQKGRHT
jgi:hypothetical protein